MQAAFFVTRNECMRDADLRMRNSCGAGSKGARER